MLCSQVKSGEEKFNNNFYAWKNLSWQYDRVCGPLSCHRRATVVNYARHVVNCARHVVNYAGQMAQTIVMLMARQNRALVVPSSRKCQGGIILNVREI